MPLTQGNLMGSANNIARTLRFISGSLPEHDATVSHSWPGGGGACFVVRRRQCFLHAGI